MGKKGKGKGPEGIQEWAKRRAEAIAAETEALAVVLRERITWQLERWAETDDEQEKKIYHNMVLDDDEALQELEASYEQKKKSFKRYGIDLPDIDFTSELP